MLEHGNLTHKPQTMNTTNQDETAQLDDKGHPIPNPDYRKTNEDRLRFVFRRILAQGGMKPDGTITPEAWLVIKHAIRNYNETID